MKMVSIFTQLVRNQRSWKKKNVFDILVFFLGKFSFDEDCSTTTNIRLTNDTYHKFNQKQLSTYFHATVKWVRQISLQVCFLLFSHRSIQVKERVLHFRSVRRPLSTRFSAFRPKDRDLDIGLDIDLDIALHFDSTHEQH